MLRASLVLLLAFFSSGCSEPDHFINEQPVRGGHANDPLSVHRTVARRQVPQKTPAYKEPSRRIGRKLFLLFAALPFFLRPPRRQTRDSRPLRVVWIKNVNKAEGDGARPRPIFCLCESREGVTRADFPKRTRDLPPERVSFCVTM